MEPTRSIIRGFARGAAAAALLLACVLGLAGPPSARAAVTCAYSGSTDTVAATASADADVAIFLVESGDIAVNGSQCGAADVTNTDTITFDDNSPNDAAKIEIDLRGGSFAPGVTDEGILNADEIEFRLNVGGGFDNWLTIWGNDTGNDGITAGTEGITLNSLSERGVLSIADEDVTNAAGSAAPAIGSGLYRVFAGGGDDDIRGDGSDGTGSPSSYDKVLNGAGGNDTLIGGNGTFDNHAPGPGDDIVDGMGGTGNLMVMGGSNPGVTVDLSISGPQNTVGTGTDTISNIDEMQGTDQPDILKGHSGANRIDGLGGADVIRGAGGDDELNGSLDTVSPPHQGDTLAYDGVIALSGQSVDLDALTSTGGQGTDDIKGFDNVIGSDYADPVLRGDALANRITGGPGDDNIFGLAGADTLLARDGGHDSVDCGADSDPDTVETDAQGVDTLISCLAPDVVNFPPSPSATPAKKRCKKGFRLKKVKTKSGKVKKKCVRKKRR